MSGDWDDDEPIGYGRPPKYTRFRKGQSGNPKGRRRKKPATAKPEPIGQSAYDDAFRAELDALVTINTPEGPAKITKAIAMKKAHMAVALKGNALALRDMAKEEQALEARELMRAEEAHQEALRREEEQRQAFRRMVAYRADRANEWAQAEVLGTEPDDPWLHPEDILLDPAKQTYRIRGPVDATDLPFFEWVRAERDILFIKAFLDRDPTRPGLSSLEKARITLWVSYDVVLPQRWQLNCNPEDALWQLPFQPERKIHQRLADCQVQASRLRPRFQRPEHQKEGYRLANSVMKPLLKRQGYRSLAQFERAWEETGGDPPWPRTPR